MITPSPRLVQESGRWKIDAPAKLNLGLRVFPARPDGFHNLETWMLPISLHDTLTIEPADQLFLEITGRNADIPTNLHKNLITRAALKLADVAGIPPRARITLHKVIPPGGGLGGGSSDAAQALVALNELWQLRHPPEALEAIAATLGSDIPFFIRATPSLCTGRGEIMTPLPPAHPLFAVLLIPPIGCPTKDVYHAFDAGHRYAPAKSKTDWQTCAAASAEQLSGMLVNDLEPAAFSVAPPLRELRDKARHLAGTRVHLTGSGSTLFVLCGSGVQAGHMQARLESELENQCACVPVKILPGGATE